MAARHPERLVIGVDAVAEQMRESSRRLAAKPARGGLPNALLGRLPLADAPGELAGIADSLTVLLPWAGLLAAVTGARSTIANQPPENGGLRALRRICRTGADVHVVFGYGVGTGSEASVVAGLGLPTIDDAGLANLEAAYGTAGFRVTARPVGTDQVRTLATTWSGRLAWSAKDRMFVELRGSAT